MTPQTDLLAALAGAVSDMDDETAVRLTQEALAVGTEPTAIIEQALRVGITMVGDRFACGEAFVPELMLAAKTMKAALEILKPALAKAQTQAKSLGLVVIGTVVGDLHDIGKDLVISMLEMSGFEIIDLGVDVPAQRFVQSVEEHRPQVVGLSALMSTSIREQSKVIEALAVAGLREGVKVIVGGAATTPEWAESIGADGYSDNAVDAARMVRAILGI
jgi:5-methyltetrahydrofolate--homocysteine methyltransferase